MAQPGSMVDGHTKGVNSACFSNCSRFVCTAGEDSKCAVWERSSGNLVGYLDSMHTAAINCIRFSCEVWMQGMRLCVQTGLLRTYMVAKLAKLIHRHTHTHTHCKGYDEYTPNRM